MVLCGVFSFPAPANECSEIAQEMRDCIGNPACSPDDWDAIVGDFFANYCNVYLHY
jgi:hypothetical protein